MKFSKVRNALGRSSIKALLDCGTVLGIEKRTNDIGSVCYFIDSKPVKNTGKTNKRFAKYFDDFAEMHKKLL